MRIIIICIMKCDSIKISVAESQLAEMVEPEAPNACKSAIKTISSEALLAGAREVIINHASEQYLLRLTNQGKLILTK